MAKLTRYPMLLTGAGMLAMLVACTTEITGSKASSGDPFRTLIGYNSFAPAYQTPSTYDTELLTAMADLLPVEALRFPGGTPANYFDWDTMTIDQSLVAAAGVRHLTRRLQNMRNDNDGVLPAWDLASFSRLVTPRGAAPFIVLNVYYSSYEQTIAAVDYVDSIFGADTIIHWELGNELSLYGYQTRKRADGSAWTVDEYIEKGRLIAAHIRRTRSNDKIGVVVGEYVDGRVVRSAAPIYIRRMMDNWDNKLSGEKWYDAVIYHPYIVLHGAGKWYAAGLATPETIDNTRRERLWRSVRQLPSGYRDRYRQYYAGAEIWLTEVGVADVAESETGDLPLAVLAYFAEWQRLGEPLTAYLFHTFAPVGKLTSVGPVDAKLNVTFLGLAQLFLKQLAGSELVVRRDALADGWVYSIRRPGDDKSILVNTANQAWVEKLQSGSTDCVLSIYRRERSDLIRSRAVRTLADLPSARQLCRQIDVPAQSIVLATPDTAGSRQ
ncbi:MAG: hypothetical protein KJP16_13100 [Gammaproteobacteria bacterium]|nr:hypothetical protein [Gammaproteobacteria bacterium]NNL51743.1 hypothetical protein [Woeseiaceae bacterium]